MNPSLSSAAALAFLCLLGGCDGTHMTYQGTCLTCIDNPGTGKPLNYDPAHASNKPTAHYGDASLTSPLDVDTAAMRIKHAFGFESETEAQARLGSRTSRWLTQGQDFAWSAAPGSLYTMKRTVEAGSLTATVSKQGSGSLVTFKFAADRGHFGTNATAYMNTVKARAERVLR